MPHTYKNRKGEVFALHREDTPLPDGRTRTGYYFSRDVCCATGEMPRGYVVTEDKAGMPVLRKA